jgi:hypothetical protein
VFVRNVESDDGFGRHRAVRNRPFTTAVPSNSVTRHNCN